MYIIEQGRNGILSDPRYWEKLKRSKPQNELEAMDNLRFLEKQKPGIPHFHIFASLPGDSLECREKSKPVSMKRLVMF